MSPLVTGPHKQHRPSTPNPYMQCDHAGAAEAIQLIRLMLHTNVLHAANTGIKPAYSLALPQANMACAIHNQLNTTNPSASHCAASVPQKPSRVGSKHYSLLRIYCAHCTALRFTVQPLCCIVLTSPPSTPVAAPKTSASSWSAGPCCYTRHYC